MRPDDSTRVPHPRRPDPSHADRLRLVETLVSAPTTNACAATGLAWLADCLDVLPSACLVRPMHGAALTVVATHGLPPKAVDALVSRLVKVSPADVQASIELPDNHDDMSGAEVTEYEAVALAGSIPRQARAWVVVPRRRRQPDLSWFAEVFGSTLSLHLGAGAENGDGHDVAAASQELREAPENARLYEQLNEAADELERRIQAATADIVEQNELLRRQALELEQASAMKSQFLANMSHEFRTPLNAILGYTSMLLQGVAGPLEAGPRRHVSRIDSNGRHLLAIIDEILDVSQIEAGRLPIERSSFRLQELLAEVGGELQPVITPAAVPVVIRVDGDLPAVDSDRPKLKQIVLNLVGNALKFTHHGQVTLRAHLAEGGAAVDIDVIDTGIGIPIADHERIFDDFLQLDNSPTRPYGGTGLGLSICRRLAQMIGARLTVQSQVGHGSTFTVRLPLQGRK